MTTFYPYDMYSNVRVLRTGWRGWLAQIVGIPCIEHNYYIHMKVPAEVLPKLHIGKEIYSVGGFAIRPMFFKLNPDEHGFVTGVFHAVSTYEVPGVMYPWEVDV